jgi:ParB-like chromosome segregation protein Spo0J
MTTITQTMNISKAVQQIGCANVTDISERIAETQSILEVHELSRKKLMAEFKRHAKTIGNSLDKGMPSVYDSLAQMDKSIEIQKLICDETDEVAKVGRELMELLEERQDAIRSMVEAASAMA